MNLETTLPPALWSAVRVNYEKQNFTGAILDGFHYLSALLREKSGTDGDGAKLIGDVLNLENPKIKLNKLQTQSEKDAQKGMAEMLRGLYSGIRNPRSHGKFEDNEEDAQALLVFMGYLIRQIDQAKPPFSRPEFVARVFDPHFVPRKDYAEGLVAEIPLTQRLDVFLEVFEIKEQGKIEHLRYFFNALLPLLTGEERKQVYTVISDELKKATDEKTIRFVIGSLGKQVWASLEKTAQMRIEHMLINAVKAGKYDHFSKKVVNGSLGTWVQDILPIFVSKNELLNTIVHKFSSTDKQEQYYAFNYLWRTDLACLSDKIPPALDRRLTKIFTSNEFGSVKVFNTPVWKDSWSVELVKAYKAYNPFDDFDDDIPF